jgi:hypothetical protein
MIVSKLMPKEEYATLLKQVQDRQDTIRVQVQSVCQGFTNAMFLYGKGGYGKSYTVLAEMRRMVGRGWTHHTGFTTPKGLFLEMMKGKDHVHLFEDCEDMYKHNIAATFLRAACGQGKDGERWIEYKTNDEDLKFEFTGGVIIISNQNLSKTSSVLAAVASRFRPVKWELTTKELIAVMLEISEHDWVKKQHVVKAENCRTVAEWLIGEMTSGGQQFGIELRTFTEHALPAFAQWQVGDKKVDWKDVLKAKLQGEVGIPEGRDLRNEKLEELAFVLSLRKMNSGEREAEWHKMTGLKKTQYYQHLAAARAARDINPGNKGGVP